jgi:two-component system CheB/CheR fusion protein
VLISDLGLPDGTGHDLLGELLARGKRMTAIALSGYGTPADIEKSKAAGFATHLVKPVKFDSLNAALVHMANSGAHHRRKWPVVETSQ